jgi:hypothetical protein
MAEMLAGTRAAEKVAWLDKRRADCLDDWWATQWVAALALWMEAMSVEPSVESLAAHLAEKSVPQKAQCWADRSALYLEARKGDLTVDTTADRKVA